ncbi:MAG: hypothetical protein IJO26_00280 [Clostridium sp.]|nr:hypothetical protein [Clostridium sp.]
MKYIFINPVVDKMYIKDSLDEVLLKNGYIRVEVKNDWHGIVKEKYRELYKNRNGLTILDRRCPASIELIDKQVENEKVIIPKIDPILIHCGIEISEREDLKDKKKVITTPCKSLADYGNKLNLEDTVFISWNEFVKQLDLDKKIERKTLDESPIPLGYFTSLGFKTSSISGKDNIENHFKNGLYKEDELIEMLYCTNGCNNGDGVLMDE